MSEIEKRKISEIDDADYDCPVCLGEGWVCEEHDLTAWGDGDECCGAAGMPCKCNPLYKYNEYKHDLNGRKN